MACEVLVMKILWRLRTAFLAFKDPSAYLEGLSIRRIAREITDRGGMGVVVADRGNGDYIVHFLTYSDQAAIERYLGWRA
jgi:hypothetical protein